MAKNKVKGPAGEHDVDAQVEERCVSIISNLFYGLAAKGERRQRLAAKFVEAEFEKCDRLLEVYFKWVDAWAVLHLCGLPARLHAVWHTCLPGRPLALPPYTPACLPACLLAWGWDGC
jgi:hypothetical protein